MERRGGGTPLPRAGADTPQVDAAATHLPSRHLSKVPLQAPQLLWPIQQRHRHAPRAEAPGAPHPASTAAGGPGAVRRAGRPARHARAGWGAQKAAVQRQRAVPPHTHARLAPSAARSASQLSAAGPRPHRCMYVSASGGSARFTTRFTRSRSTPRAARSVVTATRSLRRSMGGEAGSRHAPRGHEDGRGAGQARPAAGRERRGQRRIGADWASTPSPKPTPSTPLQPSSHMHYTSTATESPHTRT